MLHHKVFVASQWLLFRNRLRRHLDISSATHSPHFWTLQWNRSADGSNISFPQAPLSVVPSEHSQTTIFLTGKGRPSTACSQLSTWLSETFKSIIKGTDCFPHPVFYLWLGAEWTTHSHKKMPQLNKTSAYLPIDCCVINRMCSH